VVAENGKGGKEAWWRCDEVVWEVPFCQGWGWKAWWLPGGVGRTMWLLWVGCYVDLEVIRKTWLEKK